MSYPNYQNGNQANLQRPPQQGQLNPQLNAQAQNFATRSQGGANGLAQNTPVYGLNAPALGTPQPLYNPNQFPQLASYPTSGSPVMQNSSIPIPPSMATPPRSMQQPIRPNPTPSSHIVYSVLARMPPNVKSWIKNNCSDHTSVWLGIQAWLRTDVGKQHAVSIMRSNANHPGMPPQQTRPPPANPNSQNSTRPPGLRPISQLNPAHQQALQAMHRRSSGGSPQPQSQTQGNVNIKPTLLPAAPVVSGLTTQPPRILSGTPVSQVFRPTNTTIVSGLQNMNRPVNSTPAPTFGSVNQPARLAPGFSRDRMDDRDRDRDAIDTKKRRDEGLRGLMRGDISRLMYGAGDVPDPAADTIDVMEDMVIEFMSDLCRPTPPLRSNPSALLQTTPLSSQIVRHRLSRPSMRKYLDRFDTMFYMTAELARSRRVLNPTQNDLLESVGKDFLGLGDTGTGQPGEGPKRKGRPKRVRDNGGAADGSGSGNVESQGSTPKKAKVGRPPKANPSNSHSRTGSISGRGSVGPVGDLLFEERKKPGPKKGFRKPGGGVCETPQRGWNRTQSVSLTLNQMNQSVKSEH